MVIEKSFRCHRDSNTKILIATNFGHQVFDHHKNLVTTSFRYKVSSCHTNLVTKILITIGFHHQVFDHHKFPWLSFWSTQVLVATFLVTNFSVISFLITTFSIIKFSIANFSIINNHFGSPFSLINNVFDR